MLFFDAAEQIFALGLEFLVKDLVNARLRR
jgi:hypothetical protein